MLEVIDGHQLLKFLHILGFALWLGVDLGVQAIGRHIANGALPLEERLRLLKLMEKLDQFPRAMVILMLPVGIQLGANLVLIEIPDAAMSALWLAVLIWLVLVIAAHRKARTAAGALLGNLDLALQGLAMVALAGLACLSIWGSWPIVAPWLAAKAALFAATLALGMLRRRTLSRWTAGFSLQASDKARGDALIADARKTSAACAHGIWVLLILMGLLGTLKPGY